MKRAGGFTLFEVLLAVGIVVILTATIAATMMVSFNLKREAERAVDSVRDSQTVGDIWVEDLVNTVQPSVNSTQDAQANAVISAATSATGTTGGVTGGVNTGVPFYTFGPFEGDTASVAIYTTGTDRSAALQGGVCYVLYSIKTQKDGTAALVRQVETNLLSDSDPTQFPSGLPEEVMVKNVRDVEFQYYDGLGNWLSTWDSTVINPSTQMTNALPYAVEMTLTLNPASPQEEPRVIKRYATITSAPAAEAAAEAAANAAAATATGTTGIGGG